MEMRRERTVAFTGHREISLDDNDRDNLKEQIVLAIKRGYDTFLTGMASGFDLIAGETVISLKEKYPSIKLIACMPFKTNRPFTFTSNLDALLFSDLLSNADEVVNVSERYSAGVFLTRDRFMVDNCSLVISYMERTQSGTGYTVKYAKTTGVEVINIAK